MAVTLEVKAGPFAGKRVAVAEGQTVLVGRAPQRTDFALPQDTFMSSLHFVLEYGPEGCQISDCNSANGTFVNGVKIKKEKLKAGDEVRAGQTAFFVRGEEIPSSAPKPASAPQAVAAQTPPTVPVADAQAVPVPLTATAATSAALTVGGWCFATVPEGWEYRPDYGMQKSAKERFPSNVAVSEQPLPPGMSLQEFAITQVNALRQYWQEPQVQPGSPPQIRGAEETLALDARYKTKDGQEVFCRRLNARRGPVVGTLICSTLATDLPQDKPALDAIMSGLAFEPKD